MSDSPEIYEVIELRKQLARAEQAVWEQAATLLEAEAAAILTAWEHDPNVPHTTHDPVECHDRCDGYCLTHMAFHRLADTCRAKAKEAQP